jgi:hypothetical protein
MTARLALSSLRCVRIQDTLAPDEVRIRVGGDVLVNETKMSKGDVEPLMGIATEFEDEVQVELQEKDGSNPGTWEDLGDAVTIRENDAAVRPITFATGGARYELYYNVFNLPE